MQYCVNVNDDITLYFPISGYSYYCWSLKATSFQTITPIAEKLVSTYRKRYLIQITISTSYNYCKIIC